METEEVTLAELMQHTVVIKFVEMPDEIYDSFSVSNPTIKLAVDILRAAVNLKS